MGINTAISSTPEAIKCPGRMNTDNDIRHMKPEGGDIPSDPELEEWYDVCFRA
jgi:hypothetical protein